LRKLLGEDRAVVLHEGRLTLDRRYFWVDAWVFEALAEEMEATADPALAAKLGERMLALYRGPFMAGEDDAAWLIAPRERMRGRLERAVRRMPQDFQERVKLSVSEP
jgi:DNA-binding SARP family transcriptional activator